MQIVLPPEVEAIVQRQLISGKYESAIEVILAGIKLLEQQQEIYQGRLQELQKDAMIGWEASQRGEVVDEAAVIAQNPPHPAEVLQQAKAKWQEAISLLEAIPNNTFVSDQAKEKLTVYRTNYAAVTQR